MEWGKDIKIIIKNNEKIKKRYHPSKVRGGELNTCMHTNFLKKVMHNLNPKA